MTHADLLGSKIKVDRAQELLDALQREVADTIGFAASTNAVRTGHGFNEQMTEYGLWIEEVPDLLMLRFGAVIGDVVHNLRSALDHLAWELVHSVGRLGSNLSTNVQFPIYDKPKWFSENRERRLPGVPKDYWTLIESLQPYNRKNLPECAGFGAPLGKLAGLSNRDKHQVLTPVLTIGTYIPWFVPNEDLNISGREVDEGPLVPGAHIVRHFVEVVGPDPRMEVKGQASFDIAMEDAAPGETVALALTRIAGEVQRAITLVERSGGWP